MEVYCVCYNSSSSLLCLAASFDGVELESVFLWTLGFIHWWLYAHMLLYKLFTLCPYRPLSCSLPPLASPAAGHITSTEQLTAYLSTVLSSGPHTVLLFLQDKVSPCGDDDDDEEVSLELHVSSVDEGSVQSQVLYFHPSHSSSLMCEWCKTGQHWVMWSCTAVPRDAV